MSEPRSELRLRDLGREAQDLVDLPDLGALERRGRALRFRRQAGVVAAAVVLATTGVFLFQDRSQQEPEPAPPTRPQAQVYPGPLMDDLAPGTYELTPSRDGTEPTALVTVPGGWNSWEGPNRFDGHREGDSNEEALARSTWVVGVVVLKVAGVAAERCQPTVGATGRDLGYDETVAAVRQIPGYQTSVVSTGEEFFGHPATRIRLTPGAAQQECARVSELFETDTNGGVGLRGDLDLYVVDLGVTTYVVVANQVGEAPPKVLDEWERVVDSIEFS